MRVPIPAAVLLLLLATAGGAAAEELTTSAAVTEPGRSFRRALDVVLAVPPSSDQGTRRLVVVLDAGPELAASGFADAFAAALDRNARHLARTEISVLVAGKDLKPVVRRSTDAVELVAAVRAALAKPTQGFANVGAAARKAADLAGGSGDRAVLLVSLDNSDVEDDVEGTARILKKKRARTYVLTKEAYLSDTYWLSYSAGKKPPRPMELSVGGDGSFLAIPWGWLFQYSLVHESAPSGFGPYGLSRLAAVSDGRVFLFAKPAGKHACAVMGSCLFCTGDHLPPTQGYQVHRTKAIAPLLERRERALQELGSDAYYRLVVRTWTKASKLGLVRSRPSVRVAGNSLKPEKHRSGAFASVASGLNLKRNAAKAKKLAEACDQLAREHADAIERLDADAGSERSRAIADYVLAMLRLTRFNLLSFVEWCDGPGPWLIHRAPRADVAPPELAPYTHEMEIVGLSWQSWVLCHGVAPFRHVKFAQTPALAEELETLDAQLSTYFARWAHTPFELALRQAGITRFYVSVRGKGTTITPKRGGSDSDNPTTDSPRPSRGGGGSSGGGSTGPVTGGG